MCGSDSSISDPGWHALRAVPQARVVAAAAAAADLGPQPGARAGRQGGRAPAAHWEFDGRPCTAVPAPAHHGMRRRAVAIGRRRGAPSPRGGTAAAHHSLLSRCPGLSDRTGRGPPPLVQVEATTRMSGSDRDIASAREQDAWGPGRDCVGAASLSRFGTAAGPTRFAPSESPQAPSVRTRT